MSTYSRATLLEVRTIARQYADMVNSQFVTDDEFNSYINFSYYELYDILVQKYGDDYFATNTTYTTDGTTYQFNLPTDFYKFLGLDLQIGTVPNSYITIKSFMFAERNLYGGIPNVQSYYGPNNLRYRIFANTLFMTPIPAAGQNLRMWYVPRLRELVSDTDVVDGVSGWQEYLCLDGAIQALRKEESDVTILLAQKQAIIQRIEAAAEGRDVAFPQVVSDVQAVSAQWPFNGGGGWGGSW